MKLLSARAISVFVCLVWALMVMDSAAFAQTNYYGVNGSQYPIVGSLPGDQVFPDAAITPTNGLVVWQDNATDGNGWGISAERLDSTLSGTLSPFRVNVTGAGDQENARVALLKNGGAVIVWQGGTEGFQHIFARFLTPTNTFLTSTDLPVSLFYKTNTFQVNPAVAVLNDSNVVVVWASYDQAGSNSLLDVYAKILSCKGQTVTSEFLVNQFTNFNQRSPAVAALTSGGFAVAWVSEQEQEALPVLKTNTTGVSSGYYTASSVALPSVNIYARLYRSNGVAASGEFRVDTGSSPCANPSLAAGSDGGFMVAWSGYDLDNMTNGWDVFARPFTSAAVGGAVLQLNTYVVGNQFAPRLAAIGESYLATWTSMGEGGAISGVYGQFLENNGTPVGSEFPVSGAAVGQQMQPTVAADGVDQFLVVWSTFTGLPYSFDLAAQRFLNVSAILQPMAAPSVWAPFVLSNNVYQPQLQVSWPPVLGLSVADYEVYADGAGTPTVVVATNSWLMTAADGLTPSSTHSFAVDYVTTGGQRSPISPSASGTTWSGANYYGVPVEWVEEYYGLNISSWPSPNTPLAPGGPTLLQVFLSGGNPTNSATWLQQDMVKTPQGIFLQWNTQPGATYQVQASGNFNTWTNVGEPRYAAGTNDSINVGSGKGGYYRVVLMR